MPQTKVLIADNRYLMREGIKAVLGKERDFFVLDYHAQSRPLSALVDEVHIIVFGLHERLLEEVRVVRQQATTLSVLAVVNAEETQTVRDLHQLGVQGILTTHCSEAEMLEAVYALAGGEAYYCNRIQSLIKNDPAGDLTSLTSRELEVLKLIAAGYSSKKMAEALFVSIHTINTHRKNILRKLDLKSPIQLITYALEHNLRIE